MALIDSILEEIGENGLGNRDFVIYIGDDRLPLTCHRLVLRLASALFERLLEDESVDSLIIAEYSDRAILELMCFVYTTKLKLNADVVYEIVDASQHFEMHLPDRIDEYVSRYLLQRKYPIAGTLDLFSKLVLQSPERVAVIEGLSRHIMKLLSAYVNETSVLQFHYEHWDALMNQRWYLPEGQELDFLRSFFSWLYDEPTRWREYFNRTTMDRMQFEYGPPYGGYRRRLNEMFSTASKPVNQVETKKWLELVPRNLPTIHLYVADTDTFKTHIFSVDRSYPFWTETYVMPFSYEFMASIGVDDRLYTLGYSSRSQHFRSFTSVTGIQMRSLKPPPAMYQGYELCERGKCVFMASFAEAVHEPYYPHGEQYNSQGIYTYNTEIDEWFSAPALQESWRGVAITAHRELVYLVGRPERWLNAHEAIIYALDERDRCGWRSLQMTTGRHNIESMTCCGHEEHVYLCSGSTHSTLRVERYDIRAGAWQSMRQMSEDMMYAERLLSFENAVWAVGKTTPEDFGIIETYNPNTTLWRRPLTLRKIQDLKPDFDFVYMDSVIFKSVR